MKKLISIFLSIMLIAALAACSGNKPAAGAASGDAPAASGDAIKWTMATIYAEPVGGNLTHMSLGAAMQKFINDVNEKSGGRLVIEGYYSSVLGSSVDTFQQMERGELTIFYGQPMASVDTRFGAWSIPYLFKDYDEIKTIACDPDGDFFKLAAEWIGEHNGTLLASGITNTRGIFNSKHAVVTVEDVKDLKIRTYEDPVVNVFWGDICQAMPMPVSEVYTALQTNAIDGLEFSVNSIISRKYIEVGKYYTDINWQWAAGASFVVNSDAFNALPDDLKEIVTQCAREAAVYQGELEIKDEEICFEQLEETGCEIHYLSDEERQAWIDYAESISGKIRDAVGPEAYDQVVTIVDAACT